MQLKDLLFSTLPHLQNVNSFDSSFQLLSLSDASADCTTATDALFKTILGFNYSALTDDTAQSVFSSNSCGTQIEDVWNYSSDNIPSQAKIGGWCRGCAVRIRAALATAQQV